MDEMVEALLAGRKTQTRRLIRDGSVAIPPNSKVTPMPDGDFLIESWPKQEREFNNFGRSTRVKPPYGGAGDRIFVRENITILWVDRDAFMPHRCPRGPLVNGDREQLIAWHHNTPDPRTDAVRREQKRSGRFMPRWATRIVLEVESVDVQRVHDISEEDAKAEGVEACPSVDDWYPEEWANGEERLESRQYRDSFMDLWNGIHSKCGGWEANHWAWVVKFRRVA